MSSNRRLKRATEYVERMWFPVNSKLLTKLQKGLEEGVYDLDLEFLLLELKTDFALYSRLLQQLSLLLRDEGLPAPQIENTLEFLKYAGIERVKCVLCNPALFKSDHIFEALSPEQLQRLQESLITAVSVETLSERSLVNPDSGFSAGLLRQLGLTLVAWNYPQIYHRIAAHLPEGVDLEEALSDALGFAPSTLTLALVSDWILAPEVHAVIKSNAAEGNHDNSYNETVETLRSLCEVGEALARANNPETYPEASKDWGFALEEISNRLGQDGLRAIQLKLKEHAVNYVSAFPEVFEALIDLNPESKLAQLEYDQQVEQIKQNQYLRHCRPQVAAKLNEFYKLLLTGNGQTETIRFLVHEVIPSLGYSGGCVYIVDPTAAALIPRINFGKIKLLQPAAIPLSDADSRSSPIHTAFFCNIPVIESITVGESTRTYASSAIGRTKKVGVLYLEIANAESTTGAEDLQVFKAVREALHDALKLE